jgi:alpha-mannosidase
MKEKTLFMIGNAHIDPVWLWQWQEGFHEVKATFRSALDRMNEDKDFTFTASSAAFYEWVEKNDPPMFAEIQDRVEQGRWQIVGGWWIEPDCNLPCGESFARQALYGQRYFQRKFNKIARIGYNVDSFGHNGMLPQILSKSRLKFYVFMRPMPHEKDLPGRLFWWEADDGSRVLAFRLPFSYASWHADLESHIAQCATELEPPLNETLCFYGVGDHGGGPTRANLDSIHRLNEDPRYPRLVFDQPEHWFDRVKAAGIDFPVVHDDLQHHASGCYAAHSAVKRWNRKAENLLLTAESYSAIAQWAVAQPYPPDFERAWKNVLFNQFHDILAGTSIPDAYEDVRDQLGEATSIAARALNYAVQSIAWQVKIPQEENLTPILVFNPHAWESQVNVELEINDRGSPIVIHDDAGQVTPAQRLQSQSTALWRSRLNFIANLPPLGYRTYLLHVQSPALEDTDDSTRTKMTRSLASSTNTTMSTFLAPLRLYRSYWTIQATRGVTMSLNMTR